MFSILKITVFSLLTFGLTASLLAQENAISEICLRIDAEQDALTIMPTQSVMIFLHEAFQEENISIVEQNCEQNFLVFHHEFEDRIEVHITENQFHEIVTVFSPSELIDSYHVLATRVYDSFFKQEIASIEQEIEQEIAPDPSNPFSPIETTETETNETNETNAIETAPEEVVLTEQNAESGSITPERMEEIETWNRSRHVEESSFAWHPMFGFRFSGLTGYRDSEMIEFNGENPYDAPRMTFAVGIALRWKTEQRFSLEVDTEWTMLGGGSLSANELQNDFRTVALDYLTVPFLARMHLSKKVNDIHLIFGPHVSVLLAKRYVENSFFGIFPSSSQEIGAVRPFDAGLTFGIQIELEKFQNSPLQRREIEFRISRGFVPVSDFNQLENVFASSYFRFFL